MVCDTTRNTIPLISLHFFVTEIINRFHSKYFLEFIRSVYEKIQCTGGSITDALHYVRGDDDIYVGLAKS